MTWAYYNEVEPAAAHVLRALIAANVIASGEVDERSIVDVRTDDLRGFTQCHFFAGGGLWGVAARLAGWPDDRPLWTGSCPCQPFSVAGKRAGADDPRHLWPDFFRLIRAARPAVVVGEQVAGAAGYGWFDGVSADLEGEGYASRAVDIPACAVDAPHIRQRLYWVAHADSGRCTSDGRREIAGKWPARNAAPPSAFMGNAESLGRRGRQDDEDGRGRERAPADTGAGGFSLGHADGQRSAPWLSAPPRGREGHAEVADDASGGSVGVLADAASGHAGAEWQQRSRLDGFLAQGGHDRGVARDAERASFWHDAELRLGADGKARRVGSDFCVLVDGFPAFLAAGGLGSVVEFQAEAMSYANAHEVSPGQMLRALWEVVQQEPATFWRLGEWRGVSPQEILFPFLRQYGDISGAAGPYGEGAEAEARKLRGLWGYPLLARAPLRWEPSEQFARQYPDAMHSLSRVLAQRAGEAWSAHIRANAAPIQLLATGTVNRVAALRIGGNAIVPQVAAEILGALMDVSA